MSHEEVLVKIEEVKKLINESFEIDEIVEYDEQLILLYKQLEEIKNKENVHSQFKLKLNVLILSFNSTFFELSFSSLRITDGTFCELVTGS